MEEQFLYVEKNSIDNLVVGNVVAEVVVELISQNDLFVD